MEHVRVNYENSSPNVIKINPGLCLYFPISHKQPFIIKKQIFDFFICDCEYVGLYNLYVFVLFM
jgi:hypothetical protein